ncbi:unnamed protein product [Dovyalis caffra]|uniref:Uncharacterized protein n=1 Tax=Dovyalis caffra TaxID=77055 RepID=A0AAV1SM20_9ROSI|nr:unnamed protein product [Dovyalis caffra]
MEGAYLATAVERTPKSPRMDKGGRATTSIRMRKVLTGSTTKVDHPNKIEHIPNLACAIHTSTGLEKSLKRIIGFTLTSVEASLNDPIELPTAPEDSIGSPLNIGCISIVKKINDTMPPPLNHQRLSHRSLR